MESTLFLFVIALLLHGVAYRAGFFSLGKEVATRSLVDTRTLIITFTVYIGGSFVIIPLLLFTIYGGTMGYSLSLLDMMFIPQILSVTMQVALVGLVIAYLGNNKEALLFGGNLTLSRATSNILHGTLVLFLAYPVVILFLIVSESIIQYFVPGTLPDQEAVRLLKTSWSYLPAFITMTVSATIIAPIIEEFVFRGVLQTYARNYLGPRGSILFSAFVFACFHFSMKQGLSNISLIVTLFFLALHLGLVYEKEKSLIASITTHMLFNGINIIRLFIPEV